MKFKAIVFWMCGLVVLSACQSAANPPAGPTEAAIAPTGMTTTVIPGPTPTVAAADLSNPFVYCASVGTIDQPDGRYTGEAKPKAVIEGLMKASGASAEIPLDVFSQGSVWRCMDGKVYGCFVGANLPCDSKADTSKESTPDMDAYCKSNPSAEFIPAAVTGHATIYEWKCQAGKAVAGNQTFQVDAQGYISEIWYVVEP
ncbi:hypothetical protein LARV_03136 [Longilinea arvoryzae]|uniref:Uncharacterized protein n=1 Tax=Longilinea arvoryzae TaxID=360412 RepID=A0A0S7BM26_9CHLR|nr:hypothetical protein [Longilinea arvoryzae]GAP15352.1 hypothetical protein LARV_03136 [Longilinea arvoryzae]